MSIYLLCTSKAFYAFVLDLNVKHIQKNMYENDYWWKTSTIDIKWHHLIACIYLNIALLSFTANSMVIYYLTRYNCFIFVMLTNCHATSCGQQT